MSVRESLIAFLREHSRPNLAGLRAAGFDAGVPLTGKYRRIFPIAGSGCVLKVPLRYRRRPGDAPWADPRHHARIEIETEARIRTDDSLRHLRKYTGEIYWSDPATGLILMKAYRTVAPVRARSAFQREEALIVDIFRESLGKWTADYGLQNLLRDDDLTPIVVDLGY